METLSLYSIPQGDVSKNPLVEHLHLHNVADPASIVSSSTLSSVLTPSVVPSSTTTYLLENGEVQVGAEEVVSEEVVTDEPVLVLEPTGGDSHNATYRTDQPMVVLPTVDQLAPSPMKIPALDIPVTIPTEVMHVDHPIDKIHHLEVNSGGDAPTTGEEVANSNIVHQIMLSVAEDQHAPCISSSNSEGGRGSNLLFEQSTLVRVPQNVESEIEIAEPLMVVSAETTVEGLNEPTVLLFKGGEKEDVSNMVTSTSDQENRGFRKGIFEDASYTDSTHQK